jgi:ubiquinone/menaquinone biosynthesis C-methylase UbiE
LSISFDRAAEYYDQTRAVPDPVMSRLVQMLSAELPRGELCLEIGVGTGRIALPLVEAGARIAGIDISSEMLGRLVAKTSRPWPQVAVADATRLPFRDHTFGSAIASHVLHLIPGWRDAVAEIIRVVRAGGVFIASRGGRDRPQWLQAVNNYFFNEAGNPPWPPGANSIEDVDAHMRHLGVEPRALPSLGLETVVSIEQVIANLEAGYWSACWAIDPALRRVAAAKTRAWAVREFGDLSAVRHTTWESSTWHAYDLRE